MDGNYTYSAIFDYSEEGYINIEFPMFDGLVTSVKRTGNPIRAAQEVLALGIKDYEDEHRDLPDENFIPEVNVNQKIVCINVWMPYHTQSIKEVYTKKTVTLPVWLEMIARKHNVNFSAILVKGLKEELHLD